jgi:glycogen debranching enzyme
MRKDAELARTWRARADELQERLEQVFWQPDLDLFALALDRDKQPCRVLTTNPGHVLWAGAARPDIAQRVGAKLLQPSLSTGFGLRTLEATAARYNPLSYHNGSVWPHDNGIVACGLRRYGNLDGFFEVFTGVVNAIEGAADQRVPELYCGFQRGTANKPIAYPVACAPQAWASGALLQFVTALLGLQVDGSGSVVFMDPVLPPWLDWMEVRELCVPGGSMDFAAVRGRVSCSIEILSKPAPLRVSVVK